MRITVQLQEKYGYLILPAVIFILAVVFVCILILYLKYRLQHEKKRVVDGEKAWRALRDDEKYRLRMKYLELLDALYYKVSYDKISNRQCYLMISRYVRQFVSEITGVKVSRCTLNDIRWMNMPMLAALIEELYEAEFSKLSAGDPYWAIEKTKRVIEVWN